jgi:hypothetical protein
MHHEQEGSSPFDRSYRNRRLGFWFSPYWAIAGFAKAAKDGVPTN